MGEQDGGNKEKKKIRRKTYKPHKDNYSKVTENVINGIGLFKGGASCVDQ